MPYQLDDLQRIQHHDGSYRNLAHHGRLRLDAPLDEYQNRHEYRLNAQPRDNETEEPCRYERIILKNNAEDNEKAVIARRIQNASDSRHLVVPARYPAIVKVGQKNEDDEGEQRNAYLEFAGGNDQHQKGRQGAYPAKRDDIGQIDAIELAIVRFSDEIILKKKEQYEQKKVETGTDGKKEIPVAPCEVRRQCEEQKQNALGSEKNGDDGINALPEMREPFAFFHMTERPPEALRRPPESSLAIRPHCIDTITLTLTLSNTYAQRMTSADKVTLSRIVAAPLFFLVFTVSFIPKQAAIVLLWVLFIWMELSDLVDGRLARATHNVTSFGKLFDPFADVIARVTYFLAFTSIGIMPWWVLIIILYREFGIMFLRMLLGLKGIAMGARPGGKFKAGLYMAAGALSLALHTARQIEALSRLAGVLGTLTGIAYIAAALMSLASFADYLVQFVKLYRQPENGGH